MVSILQTSNCATVRLTSEVLKMLSLRRRTALEYMNLSQISLLTYLTKRVVKIEMLFRAVPGEIDGVKYWVCTLGGTDRVVFTARAV